MKDNIQINNQNTEIPNLPNVEFQETMVAFTGTWQSSFDPILIGFNNYQTLENMRYKKDGSGIEGINGYYDFNANALLNEPVITTGIHLKTNRENDSYIIVHHSDGPGNGHLSYSTSTVGGAEGVGEFPNTYLISDNSNAQNPRLAIGPGGTVVYCNERDSVIWGGLYMPVASVLQIEESSTSTDLGYFVDDYTQGWAFPEEITEEISNKNTSDYLILSTAGKQGILLLSTRQMEGININIVSGYENTNAANTNAIKVQYYDSTFQFAPVGNLSDGTAKMTQSGLITFSNGAYNPSPFLYNETYLYAYLLSIEATSGTSSCRIYEITLKDEMNSITNMWDGIYRQPIQIQRYNSASNTYNDFTLHVNEQSTEQTPVGLYLGQLTSNDYIYMMFEEPMSAIKVVMLGGLVNTSNATLVIPYAWDGNSYVNSSSGDDGTYENGKTFAKTGLIQWNHYGLAEKKINAFGVTGYIYRFKISTSTGPISGSNPEDVVVDLIGGIPRRKKIKYFKFPITFKNRLLLCGYVDGNESHRIDYSSQNAPDVFNGEDSSNNGLQSIYVGSGDELTGALQLYNRFGSSIYSVLVITKNNETWLLTGDDPSDFQLYPISFNLGCPAPYTLTAAEVGFSIGENIERNVAMWISQQGPVMFDGAVLHPLEGIETYFDPSSSNYITISALYKAQAWFDTNYHEWNILLPTASSTTLNTWLVFNIRQRKWFKKNVNGNPDILCGIPAIASSGYRYIYGGSNDGRLYLLETGNNWNGNDITYTVKTGEFFPTNSQWDQTLLRRLRVVVKTAAANTFGFLQLSHYKNMSNNSACSTSTDISTANTRLTKIDVNINEIGWSHSLELSLSSNNKSKGFEPVMIGYQSQITRKDV